MCLLLYDSASYICHRSLHFSAVTYKFAVGSASARVHFVRLLFSPPHFLNTVNRSLPQGVPLAYGSLFWAVLRSRSCGVHFPPWVLCYVRFCTCFLRRVFVVLGCLFLLGYCSCWGRWGFWLFFYCGCCRVFGLGCSGLGCWYRCSVGYLLPLFPVIGVVFVSFGAQSGGSWSWERVGASSWGSSCSLFLSGTQGIGFCSCGRRYGPSSGVGLSGFGGSGFFASVVCLASGVGSGAFAPFLVKDMKFIYTFAVENVS